MIIDKVTVSVYTVYLPLTYVSVIEDVYSAAEVFDLDVDGSLLFSFFSFLCFIHRLNNTIIKSMVSLVAVRFIL